MNIDQARALKYGERVACPSDRGDPAFFGTVRTPTEMLATSDIQTVNGIEFIWVEVMRTGHHKSVWPSNRLGKL